MNNSEPAPEPETLPRPSTGEGLGESDCSDSWKLIDDEHAKITFWRDAWKRADENPKHPRLLTVKEYIETRWHRANKKKGNNYGKKHEYSNRPSRQVVFARRSAVGRVYGG